MLEKRQKVQDALDALDVLVISSFEEYKKELKDFDVFRDVVINTSNVININEQLMKIQMSYEVVYPAFHYVMQRYGTIVKIINEYNDSMKAATDAEPQMIKDRSL